MSYLDGPLRTYMAYGSFMSSVIGPVQRYGGRTSSWRAITTPGDCAGVTRSAVQFASSLQGMYLRALG